MADYNEPYKINHQADATDNKNQFRVLQLLPVKKAFNGFDENAEAEREEENIVDQSAKHLSSHPSVGVSLAVRFPFGNLG